MSIERPLARLMKQVFIYVLRIGLRKFDIYSLERFGRRAGSNSKVFRTLAAFVASAERAAD